MRRANRRRFERALRPVVESLEERRLLSLTATYFDNADLTGPSVRQIDNNVFVNWGQKAPDPRLNADSFSVRWTGKVLTPNNANVTEAYTFSVRSDDGCRLWIDGVKIIDNYVTQSQQWSTGTTAVSLAPNTKHDIKLEYFDNSGTANVQLNWSTPHTADAIIPKENLFADGATGGPAAPSSLTATAASAGRINLTWPAATGSPSSYLVERSSDGGSTFAQVAVTDAAATGYTDLDLAPGTPYTYRVRSYNSAGTSAYTATATATTSASTLPAGWTPQDVGLVGADGTATQSGGTFTLGGAGVGTGQTADSFRYAFQSLTGGGQVVARVTALPGTNTAARAGVMFRDALTPGAFDAFLALKPGGGAVFETRATAQTSTDPGAVAVTTLANYTGGVGITVGAWVKIVRAGNVFTASVSPDGTAWTQVGSTTVPIGATALVGLASTSGVYGTAASATFTNVAVTPAVVPPAAPGTPTLSNPTVSTIDVSWADQSTNETGFLVEAATDAGFTQGPVTATAGANATGLTLTGLTPGVLYYVHVRATNATGNSAYAPAAAPLATRLEPPSNLILTSVSPTQVDLSWADNSANDTGFEVDRSTDPNFPAGATTTLPAAAAALSDSGLTAGTTYYYRVRAVNGVPATSDYTPVAQVTTPASAPSVPAAPSNLRAVPVSPTHVDLNWSDNSSDETGFTIERRGAWDDYQSLATVGAGVTSYADTNAEADTTYYYRVRAYNAAGASAFTPGVPVETAPATPGDGLTVSYYDDPDFTGQSTSPTTATPATADFAIDWGSAAPAPVLAADTFSAVFTGRFLAGQTTSYRFGADLEGGARVWVNGVLVVDHWQNDYQPGDTNRDGTVNNADFQILYANLNKPGSWTDGDFNADGQVNFADYQILERNFGTTQSPVRSAGLAPVSLTQGQLYDVRVEFFNEAGLAHLGLVASTDGGATYSGVPVGSLYAGSPQENPGLPYYRAPMNLVARPAGDPTQVGGSADDVIRLVWDPTSSTPAGQGELTGGAAAAAAAPVAPLAHIERSLDGGQSFQEIGTTVDGHFDDVAPGHARQPLYRVWEEVPGTAGRTAPSNVAPVRHAMFQAAYSDAQVSVAWEGWSAQVDHYVVEQTADHGGTYRPVMTVGSTVSKVVVDGLGAGAEYGFRVVGYDAQNQPLGSAAPWGGDTYPEYVRTDAADESGWYVVWMDQPNTAQSAGYEANTADVSSSGIDYLFGEYRTPDTGKYRNYSLRMHLLGSGRVWARSPQDALAQVFAAEYDSAGNPVGNVVRDVTLGTVAAGAAAAAASPDPGVPLTQSGQLITRRDPSGRVNYYALDYDDFFPDQVNTGEPFDDPLYKLHVSRYRTAANAAQSSDPVVYADGRPVYETADLVSDGFGGTWGQVRSYAVDGMLADRNVNGWGMVAKGIPHLIYDQSGPAQAAAGVGVAFSATDVRWFTNPETFYNTWWTELGRHDSFDGSAYRDDAGNTYTFSASGLMSTYTDAAGNVTTVTPVPGSSDRIQTITRTTPDGALKEFWDYAYYPAGDPNVGLLKSVTLRRGTDPQSAATVRWVDYTYYDFGDANGHLGDLKTATVREPKAGSPNGVEVGTQYYRYYSLAESEAANPLGFLHGLKYVFDEQAYAQLLALTADKTADEVFAMSNAAVAPYAAEYFEYDRQRRVTRHDVRGQGASGGGIGGIGTFRYEYFDNEALAAPTAGPGGVTVADTIHPYWLRGGQRPLDYYHDPEGDFNEWRFRTTETLPDGSKNIVYTNAAGQAILTVVQEGEPGTPAFKQWPTFQSYDTNGRLRLVAHPSAFAPASGAFYSEANPDLVGYRSVHPGGQFLSPHDGLIDRYDYYPDQPTPATGPDGDDDGEPDGYLKDYGVLHGIDPQGTYVRREQFTYQWYSGLLIHPVATDTLYPTESSEDTDPARQTVYTYALFPGTSAFKRVTITRPSPTAAGHVPTGADTTQVEYDLLGRPVWTRDADGFLTYTAYDDATGAVTKQIIDVDTTRTSDFTGLPSGWTTPAGGGLHLVTSTQVDALGRRTQTIDPNGNVTYQTYDDAEHSTRVYRGWHQVPNTSTYAPTGPVEMYREDLTNAYTEALTYAYVPSTDATPTGTDPFDQTSLRSLARDYIDPAGQLYKSDRYFSFANLTYSTAADLGTEGVNFYRTQYGYDAAGRLDRVVTPVDATRHTITRTRYDALDRPTDVWVGTDDSAWDPTSTGSQNMALVTSYQYDENGVGDSNLTAVIQHPSGKLTPGSGDPADRTAQIFYDWRDRPLAAKAGIQSGEADGTHRLINFFHFDNLDELVLSESFAGDGVTLTDGALADADGDGQPDGISASRLRSKVTTEYDEQGRGFAVDTYSVDETGNVGATPLRDEVWYDLRGNVAKARSAQGAVTKTHFDGAGRPDQVFLGDGGGDATWADALDVSGDVVLSQTEVQYDGDGNPVLRVTHDRFHDAAGTGALGDHNGATASNPAAGQPAARVSYQASYYDAADRQIATANFGTHGGTPPAADAAGRPVQPSLPARSGDVLVDTYAYDDAGRLAEHRDPRDLATQYLYDGLGRTTDVVEAADLAVNGGNPTDSNNRTTRYTYDGMDHVTSVSAILPAGQVQTTAYDYGVTTAGGSSINSFDLLSRVRYPDKSTGAASAAAADQESFSYDAIGERVGMVDRNGTTHTYGYDVLGRLVSDAVTLAAGNPQNVDGAVRKLGYAYDDAGRLFRATSYDASNQAVNQVERHYNGFGQLTDEYQAHTAAEVAAGTANSPVVHYGYSGAASGSRLETMTYPNGRVLHYGYNAGVDDAIGRVSYLADDNGSGGTGQHLEDYSYLGLGTIVKRAHPQTGVDLTYIGSGSAGPGGDQYTGLDQFGRVVDQRWVQSSTGTDVDRFKYGYDADGNPLYKENTVNPALSELYHAGGPANGYDPLNRLVAFSRGQLNSTKDDLVGGSVSRTQSWTLDAQGNWTSAHDAQNELDALAYDSNGNALSDGSGKQFVYDAWNSLVAVKGSDGTTLETFGYDALGRRVAENAGAARDLYYSDRWQVIEERQGTAVKAQYVWSPGYVDALVLRDRDADGNSATGGLGKSGSGLDERLYALDDAGHNVTALVDSAGTVTERFVYDAYGTTTVLSPTWAATSDTLGWAYRSKGGRYDSVSGLTQFRNRDYSAALGRWVQSDPAGYVDGTNAYQYVSSNPNAFVDPLGLSEWTIWRTTVGVLVGAYGSGAAKEAWTPAAERVGALAQGVQRLNDDPVGALQDFRQESIDATAPVIARALNDGSSTAGALAEGTGYLVNHVVGTDKIVEGAVAIHIPTARKLSKEECVQRIVDGVAQAAPMIAAATGALAGNALGEAAEGNCTRSCFIAGTSVLVAETDVWPAAATLGAGEGEHDWARVRIAAAASLAIAGLAGWYLLNEIERRRLRAAEADVESKHKPVERNYLHRPGRKTALSRSGITQRKWKNGFCLVPITKDAPDVVTDVQ